MPTSSPTCARLEGKVALLSGSARGMGAAEARLFAQHGAQLVLGDVQDELLGKVASELRTAGHDVVCQRLDVTDERSWAGIVDAALARFGRLDVLVNNAGIADAAGIEETTRQRFDEVVAVNLTGTWLGIRAVAPALRRSAGGSIVNISSIYGIVGSTGSSAYHAAKGAVRVLTKQAALELAAAGIRVNSIHPGYVDTAMLRDAFVGRPDSELEALVAEVTPLGRLGTAEEIAFAALFLASDESSFMTGAEMVVDGGYTAR